MDALTPLIDCLSTYFRCAGSALSAHEKFPPASAGPSEVAPSGPNGGANQNHTDAAGFFQFGPDITCYGRCGSGPVVGSARSPLYDASKDIRWDHGNLSLPFDPHEVIENLYRERYEENLRPGAERFVSGELVRKSYYLVRELLPVSVRRHLQKVYFNGWRDLPFPSWPVDFSVDSLHEELLKLFMNARGLQRIPFIWFWPEGAPNCLIMTHDVETCEGRDFTSELMNIDDSFEFKASFQVIPEKRYEVSSEYIQEIRSRGFEFNLHDLNHDGHLYREKEEFLRRAQRINQYVRRFQTKGFRAGSMYRNPDWYEVFEFSYDMSVPNVAHLEPKRGGCCTVMPFFIGGIVELPLTTAQDYSLFHILNDYSIDLWKQQLGMIRRRHGLMSFISHPDYLIPPRARKTYESLLAYLREIIAREKIWAPLPGEVDTWWRARSRMNLVPNGHGWKIEGPGSDRARVAFAVLENGRLSYELP